MNNTPIEIKPIKCKKCNTVYCPCCEEKCPECGEINDDSIDEEEMFFIRQMRENL
jgi:phage FluMu protein Com